MKLRQIRVDGYKNLINCTAELGDFNILVGPNNSGKSNFLETLHLLSEICFGADIFRKRVFLCRTLASRRPTYICHLDAFMDRPLTLGINFLLGINGEEWLVDYEITVKCMVEKDDVGILHEILKAKPVGRKGPQTEYIIRDGGEFSVYKEKQKVEHKIAADIPAFQAIRSLYPDFSGLSQEFMQFYRAIMQLSTTAVFALSPSQLREQEGKEKDITGRYVSSFDLPLLVDRIQKEEKYYELFKKTVCDILDLEDVTLYTTVPSRKGVENESPAHGIRLLILKRKGDNPGLIGEFSDGTFAVVAILAVLLSDYLRGSMLFIEELENYLHPAALKKMISFLKDNADRWPVLITTHSPYLLNIVNPEDVNVAVVGEDGATHFEKVRNTAQLRNYLKTSMVDFGDLLVTNFAEVMEKPK